MPQFPMVPQRARAPAPTSDHPQARENLQAAREAKRARDKAEAARLAEAAAQPEGAADIDREQRRFDAAAAGVRQDYKDHPLEEQVTLQLEEQRQAWNRNLVAAELRMRAEADLARADEIAALWLARVTKAPAEFDAAAESLLGEEGPLQALGVRPAAQAAWEAQTFDRLLSAQMAGDPRQLLSDLEAGRWQDRLSAEGRASWLEDAREAAALRARSQASERRQQAAGEALSLQQSIARGEAGLAEIRRAERDGRLTPEQLEGLKREAGLAATRARTARSAQGDYAVALTRGEGFDAENPQHRQAAEDFYRAVFRDEVRGGAGEAARERVADSLAKTGFLTKGLAQDLTAALLSGVPERQLAAAQLYGRLQETVPDLLPRALEPEVRARGGVLNRWLEAGLPPEEALRRAERELAPDGAVPFLDEEETAGLQRDLGGLFFGEAPARHVASILDLLERNYLDDLGQGLTPRQARAKLRRDAGRVIRKVNLLRAAVEGRLARVDASAVNLVSDAPQLHRVGLLSQGVKKGAGKGGSSGNAWLYGPFGNPLDDELAAAAARELQETTGDLNEVADWSADQTVEAFWRMLATDRPDVAAWFGYSMQSIGDGGSYLGETLEEDGHKGSRLVGIWHPEHGRMVLHQKEENPRGRFGSTHISFVDPETGEWVTERLPNPRFVTPRKEGLQKEVAESVAPAAPEGRQESGPRARVVPGDEHRPVIYPQPPAEPVLTFPPTPFPADGGRERVPNHTGGNQTDPGVMGEQQPGYQERDRKYDSWTTTSPVHDPIYDLPFVVSKNADGTIVYDGIPISERFIHKAGEKHPVTGVLFDEKGYPIFDDFAIETVQIELTGSRNRDKRLASKEALKKGILTKIPKDYVWHHHQDMKTMQLIPRWIHEKTGHAGGHSNNLKAERNASKNK